MGALSHSRVLGTSNPSPVPAERCQLLPLLLPVCIPPVVPGHPGQHLAPKTEPRVRFRYSVLVSNFLGCQAWAPGHWVAGVFKGGHQTVWRPPGKQSRVLCVGLRLCVCVCTGLGAGRPVCACVCVYTCESEGMRVRAGEW